MTVSFEGASSSYPWADTSTARESIERSEVTDLVVGRRPPGAEVSFERLSSFGRADGGRGGSGGGSAGGGISAVALAVITAVIVTVLITFYVTLTGGVALVIDPQGASKARSVANLANNGRRFGGRPDRPLIPLWAPRFGALRGRSEAHTLTALCDAISSRPELRERLGDPGRAAQLIADLQRWNGRVAKHRGGLRRKRFEIMSAAAKLGYLHRNGGRPLPDEPIEQLDDVVDAILGAIGRNPYARYLHMDRRQVAELLHHHYVSVTPWPFHALTE